MTDRPGLDFSFSGLKTSAANTINQALKQEGELTEQTKADIAFAFQDSVVDTLAIKCKRALKETGYKRLVIAGGVSANKKLRETLGTMMKNLGGEVFYPQPQFCTDNGAMIAYTGFLRLKQGQHSDLAIDVKPRWAMAELPAI